MCLCAGSNLDLGLDLSPGLGSRSAWSGARHGCTGRWEGRDIRGREGDIRQETGDESSTPARPVGNCAGFKKPKSVWPGTNNKWGGSLHYPMSGHWAAAGVASLFRARLSLSFFLFFDERL